MELLMLIMTFAGSLLAIVFAALTARKVLKFPEGTERMQNRQRPQLKLGVTTTRIQLRTASL